MLNRICNKYLLYFSDFKNWVARFKTEDEEYSDFEQISAVFFKHLDPYL